MNIRIIDASNQDLKKIKIMDHEDVRVLFDLRGQDSEITKNITVKVEGKSNLYVLSILDKRSIFHLNMDYELAENAYIIINNNAFVMDSAQIHIHDKSEIKHPIREIHIRQQVYLYSTQARGEAIPELILKTNKVKAATHESFISDINEKEKEYFASKGMNLSEVQQLLLEDYLSYCKGEHDM